MLLKIVWVKRKPDDKHTVYIIFWAEKRWKRGATYIFRNFFFVSLELHLQIKKCF